MMNHGSNYEPYLTDEVVTREDERERNDREYGNGLTFSLDSCLVTQTVNSPVSTR